MDLIPWLAMACSLALILLLPRLSEGPPQLPRHKKLRHRAHLRGIHPFGGNKNSALARSSETALKN
jgi:hypothetical protein